MKLGKLILGAGVVTSALAVYAGLNTQSAAAAADPTAISNKDIAINFEEQQIVVKEDSSNTTTTDNKLYVAVGKYKANTPTVVTANNWIEYDNDTINGVTIDTSSLAVAKEQYIVIKGDKNEKALVLHLSSTLNKLSAAVEYIKNDNSSPTDLIPQIKIKDITNGKFNASDVSDTIQYSTLNGKWGDFIKSTESSHTDLKSYQKLGATLKVRIKAGTGITAGKVSDATEGITLNGTATKACKIAGKFASKEMRVKIAKLAAGPKVSVNYLNNTVSLPKTAEYRTDTTNNYTSDGIDSSKKTTIVKVKDFNTSADATLDVRTKYSVNSSNDSKSKSASNITEVAIPKSAITAVKAKVDNNTEIVASNFGAADLGKVTADEGSVSFTYGTGDKLGTGTFTNTEALTAYEIYVTSDSTLGVVGSNLVCPDSNVTGAKKLAAGYGKTLVIKGLKNGDKIFIRKAGDQKKKVFASAFGAFGTVKLPEK